MPTLPHMFEQCQLVLCIVVSVVARALQGVTRLCWSLLRWGPAKVVMGTGAFTVQLIILSLVEHAIHVMGTVPTLFMDNQDSTGASIFVVCSLGFECAAVDVYLVKVTVCMLQGAQYMPSICFWLDVSPFVLQLTAWYSPSYA